MADRARRTVLTALTAATLVAVIPPHAAKAQPRTADPTARGVPLTSFPRMIRLADRVYGYEEIRAPGFTTVSLVVVGDSGVLLADGQGNPEATRRLLAEIRRLTPLPLRWYVMGSDHGDHTAGNSELPRDITWIVHPTSRAQLARDSVAAEPRPPADSAPRATPPGPVRTVVVPPTAMTSDRQQVDVGGTIVDVRFLGRAHTGGDLLVHLPRERILFMSEAYLNRVFPAMRSAYPSEWVRVVDSALAMPVDRYVPGHGFIEEPTASREELIAFRDALRAVVAEVKRLRKAGATRDEIIARANWGPYAQWFLVDQQAPIAVRRVWDELDGRLPPPNAK